MLIVGDWEKNVWILFFWHDQVALKGMLLQAKQLPRFWRLSRLDGMVWILTFLSVVLVGIDVGLLAGLLTSLASILLLTIEPYTCLLGHVPSTDLYLDVNRYKGVRRRCNTKTKNKTWFFVSKFRHKSLSDFSWFLELNCAILNFICIFYVAFAICVYFLNLQTTELRGIKIFHYCGGLNFANSGHFKLKVFKLVDVTPQKILKRRMKLAKNDVYGNEHVSEEVLDLRCIIMDMSALSYVDPTGIGVLHAIADEFSLIDVAVYLAGCSWPVFERIMKCDKYAKGEHSFKIFATIHDAVKYSLDEFASRW